MLNPNLSISRSETAILATNKVLKNTYALLSMTLIFSALMAGVSMAIEAPHGISLFSMIASMLLIFFVLPRTANTSAGLFVIFGITGLLGFGLGPMLNYYMAMGNGSQLITTALGGTGVIFLALSGYVLTSRKDFTFLGGFLIVGFMLVLMASIANLFFGIPAASLAISAAVILIMSGFILYDTSRIIHGGETNYIMATMGLYLSLYNIFVHLLAILGANND